VTTHTVPINGVIENRVTLPEGVVVPSEHYSKDPAEAVFFYGGPFSNFVTEMGGSWGDKRLFITAWHRWVAPPGGPMARLERIAYGAEYRSVEHFFQASKALTYDDHEWVREAWKAAEAKFRGRGVRMRSDWEDVKYRYMLIGLRAKFAPGSFMATFLLATGERFIAEDSPTDPVWGIRDSGGGLTGQNLLGKALMEVRQELRDAEQAQREREAVIQQGMDALETLEGSDAQTD
jgi:ribA/ribD-fused uncharacterized protein